MKKILVIGAAGQLGQCLQKVARELSVSDIVFLNEHQCNILDLSAVQEVLETNLPKYVINCAAYTAVDLAEDEPERAYAINATGPLNLAIACKQVNATLIHISTDFVFKGNDVTLLQETDNTHPISEYGKTKLEGELVIKENIDRYYIIRTSWLYSEFAANFVKTMRKLGKERTTLNVVADQIGTPTYGVDLAHVLLKIVSSDLKAYGIYHYSNEGVISWYDFAVAIFEMSNLPVKVQPIPSSAYPTKARRPSFSVMDKAKIKSTFDIEIPYWRESLARCIAVLEEGR